MLKTIILGLLIVMTILANRKWQFDADAGGEPSILKHKAAYNKALIHLAFAFLLTVSLLLVGIPVLGVALLSLVGILGWEWSQRVYRKWDIIGGLAGSTLAMAYFLYHITYVRP
jgi:hypothetical protein